MNHTCLFFPSRSWYSLTDPGGMEGWVGLGQRSEFNSAKVLCLLGITITPSTNCNRQTDRQTHGQTPVITVPAMHMFMFWRVLPLLLKLQPYMDSDSGMYCPNSLFWRRHFQVSGADLNPSSCSSHILILSSNCIFDTIVVLVAVLPTADCQK